MPLARDPESLRAFIVENTEWRAPPLLPELPLHLATEVTPLWRATEKYLDAEGIEPPFWAFAWAGGQAIARYLLDHPEVVRGKRVLDFAAGSGLVGIAAKRAGAREVCVIDRDPLAIAAARLNAARMGISIDAQLIDVLVEPDAIGAYEVVTAGDVCYDSAWAGPALDWLRAQARGGARVLLGDPGRMYAPRDGLIEAARFHVPMIDDIENRQIVESAVYEMR